MKRWAFGSIVFFIAFGFGLATAEMFDQTSPTLGEPDENGNPKIVVNDSVVPSLPNMSNSQTQPVDHDSDPDEFFEAFTDDSRIGRARKNKIEVNCFERGSSSFAQIKFYSRANSGVWKQRQSFEFEKDDLTGCDPMVEDFNNDGLKDFTYQSNVAARGANEIRKLFIYDKKRDELVYIRNSEDYPNLAYNKNLNCLDAWLFHGATTTVFLRIEGDILKDFAHVDTGAELVVTLTGKYGRKEISRKKMNLDDVYTRYSSFDPPRP